MTIRPEQIDVWECLLQEQIRHSGKIVKISLTNDPIKKGEAKKLVEEWYWAFYDQFGLKGNNMY